MLRAIIALNIFQLLYFNLSEPSRAKICASAIFTILLSLLFFWLLRHLSKVEKARSAARVT